MSPDEIARVAHEANRAYQMATLDPEVSPPWDQAPFWQRKSAITGVLAALDGANPEQLHESWMAEKAADGWVYGPVKNFKTRTHPCLVPYAELPQGQRVKDDLFAAIVTALKP